MAAAAVLEFAPDGSRCGVPYHSVLVEGAFRFSLPTYLTVRAVVGRGSNGVVVSAHDARAGRLVAIKKLRGALACDARDCQRILWEVRLLRQLRHDNLISLVDLLLPSEQSGDEGSGDLYLVMPLLESDLHRIIYSGQPLTDEHVQFFVYQMLVALKYLHSAGVIHRDVKPSNVLLNSDCCIKLADYGLSRPFAEHDMTEYVMTRWYRAPEVMLDTSHYGPSVDLWGVGCVLAELLGRKALFPGKDYMDLLAHMTRVLGSPSEESLTFISNERAKDYLRRLPRADKVPLAALFPAANPLGLDLLERLLQFNPARRITAAEALAHPYLANLHSDDPRYEPVCAHSIDLGVGAGQGGGAGAGAGDSALSSAPQPGDGRFESLHQLLWDELRVFRPELPLHPPPVQLGRASA